MKDEKRPDGLDQSDDKYLKTVELDIAGGTAGSKGVSGQGGGDGGQDPPPDPKEGEGG